MFRAFDSLAHHVSHGGLDLGLVVLRVDALAGNHAQLLETRPLRVGDGLVDLLDRLLDVQPVQVDRAARLCLVVLCGG